MSNSTVSVIVPTYNRAGLVGDAIDSLLKQTHLPAEILVVNDGSTDDTATRLARSGDPVRVLERPNGGLAAARNTGLLAAAGDYICFLDDDDTLPPGSIEQRVRLLDDSPSYDVVYGDIMLTDMQTGDSISRFTHFKPGIRPSGNIYPHLLLDNLCPVHAFMFRRKSWQQTGGFLFDENLDRLEDMDFWVRLAAQTTFLYTDVVVGDYRVHRAMMTVDDPDRMRINQLRVQHKAVKTPDFATLPDKWQARIFAAMAAKHTVLGEINEARRCVRDGLAASPLQWRLYAIGGLSLLGTSLVQRLAGLRRRIRVRLKRSSRWGY